MNLGVRYKLNTDVRKLDPLGEPDYLKKIILSESDLELPSIVTPAFSAS